MMLLFEMVVRCWLFGFVWIGVVGLELDCVILFYICEWIREGYNCDFNLLLKWVGGNEWYFFLRILLVELVGGKIVKDNLDDDVDLYGFCWLWYFVFNDNLVFFIVLLILSFMVLNWCRFLLFLVNFLCWVFFSFWM